MTARACQALRLLDLPAGTVLAMEKPFGTGLEEARALNRLLGTLVPEEHVFRVDPFLGSAALHAGIDFREETGAPVRATASGRVNEAAFVGGYGNMVEIDHGNGLATRYGHMSQILVTPGIADTQCGAKAAPRDVWRAILPSVD